MTTSIAKKEETRLARPLKVLAPLIGEDFEAAEQLGMARYLAAGEKLIEASSSVELKRGTGGFSGWYAKQDYPVSLSQARRYMALAEVTAEKPRRGFSSIREAVGEPSRNDPPRITEPTYHRPVEQVLRAVDGEALRQEAASVRDEKKLVRELGLQLIKIGYHTLSAKLHPDKGGSTEAMSRLNKVKSILEGAL